ncbi:hypothetical protein GTY20_36320 [Streptomyces sp. SID4946]|nr:hypothetical protein [Streptomyces sp. SID4946]
MLALLGEKTRALIGDEVDGSGPVSFRRTACFGNENHLGRRATCAPGVTTGTGSSHVPGKGWAARRFVNPMEQRSRAVSQGWSRGITRTQ